MPLRINNPWVVILAAASYFFFQFIQITMFNILKPELILTFHADPGNLSFISSLYFYGVVLLLIPAGVMLDYVSPRKIILISFALSLIGLTIFASATSIFMIGVGRFLVGISGGPFCLISSMRLAARWFPENRLAFVTGVIIALGMLGGMVAQLPLEILVNNYGWRTAMHANIGLGLFLLGIMYLFVKDYPRGQAQAYHNQLKFYDHKGFVAGLKKVFLKPQNWNCGLYASLLNIPILGFGALWGFMYLKQTFNLTPYEASIACMAIFLGMLIGGPIFGFISDHVLRRKTPMLAGLVLCFAAMVTLITTPSLTFSGITLTLFLVGLGSSAQILAYPTVSDSNSPAQTGSALGLASTLVMVGGAIAQPLIGLLIESKWDGNQALGVPIFTAENYNYAFWIMPIAMVLAGIAWFFIRETYCKHIEAGS